MTKWEKINPGLAPTDRKIAISRRRSFNVVSNAKSILTRLTTKTKKLTTLRAFSAIPSVCQSCCKLTPGNIADNA